MTTLECILIFTTLASFMWALQMWERKKFINSLYEHINKQEDSLDKWKDLNTKTIEYSGKLRDKYADLITRHNDLFEEYQKQSTALQNVSESYLQLLKHINQ